MGRFLLLSYETMSRRKKLKIVIPVIVLMFLAAFAKHRFIDAKQRPEGTLKSKLAKEISGIAASGLNPDIYYVHNDSGDTSRFFAITADGKLHTTIYYTADINNRRKGVDDCEDIAVGPGPVKGKSYVYLGDIGDNSSKRKFITIYRAQEKTSWGIDSLANTPTVPLHLKYPDYPKDAETLMLDPIEKLLYIVTKRGDSVGVYTAPLNYKANDTVTMTFRCRLFFKGIKPFKWITAGDISKDGKQILVKSLGDCPVIFLNT
jgi:hypothetical protein